MTKIYTKKGDQGTTSLFGGDLVHKSNPQLEAYGTLDEVNALLGRVRSELMNLTPSSISTEDLHPKIKTLDEDLYRIQNYLFNIGSHLAIGDEKMRVHLPPLDPNQTAHLEQQIDSMEQKLPPLKNFILPGGHSVASLLHLVRTVVRRGERITVSLSHPHKEILIFLNRLSDYLFVAARYTNYLLGQKDVLWEKK
ncbi:MAG: cob(I)yrinic acid a,c-diamide adenosyltransferase [Bdellovibrionales bacterium]|nr:cob(I)yrinic acid a,c-diamide adenosyltransferase [Bdellovibrionales bacterium]